MPEPKRIRLSRKKGFRLPEGAINVARPGKWGNRHKIGHPHPRYLRSMSAQDAVECFEIDLENMRLYGWNLMRFNYEEIEELRGHDLACWCELTSPWCHADSLLRIANA